MVAFNRAVSVGWHSAGQQPRLVTAVTLTAAPWHLHRHWWENLPEPIALVPVRRLATKPDPAKPDQQQKYDSLELTEERFSALTDKIPQRPVTAVEAGGYGLVILAAVAVMAFFLWQFVSELLITPTARVCFNAALERLKADPRVTVRLGDDIRAYGAEGSRTARQQLPHTIYKDARGVEHVRLQFHLHGPGGNALVNTDMYKDEAGAWQYTYLVLDVVSSASPVQQRLNIVPPRS